MNNADSVPETSPGRPNFFQEHWAAIVIGLATSTLFAIIGVFVSWVFFSASQQSRAPVFLMGARTEIVSSTRVSDAPIRVVREDGSEITGDLTALTFYFWNGGALPIRDDAHTQHILTPVTVELADPNAEIIDFRILDMTRDVVGATLARNPQDPDRVLNLAFRILEQGDGFAGQVMYIGDPASRLTIHGDIEGVPGGIGSQASFPISGWELARVSATNLEAWFIGLWVPASAALVVIGIVSWMLRRAFSMEGKRLLIVSWLVTLAVLIPIIIFCMWVVMLSSEGKIRLEALERVPPSLQIDE